jgi:peptidoglycan/LPS O-acetylase OafA/YrhL
MSPLAQNVIGRGYLWVDFFFVLSGFLLASRHGAEFCRGFELRRYGSFLVRRLARIYPLYILVSLIFLPFFFFSTDLASVADMPTGMPGSGEALWLLANALMVQSWGGASSLIGPAWSISAEWASYLLFPILTAGLLSSHRLAALTGAGLAVALLSLVAAHDPAGKLNVYEDGIFPVMRCIAGFSLGLLSSRAAVSPALKRWTTSDPVFLVALALVAALFAVSTVDVVLALAFPVLVICAANNRGVIGRSLSWRPLVLLGALSYALYLIHYPLLHLMMSAAERASVELSDFNTGLWLAAQIAILLAGAALLHFFVERPARRFVCDWPRRLRRYRPKAAPVMGFYRLRNTSRST